MTAPVTNTQPTTANATTFATVPKPTTAKQQAKARKVTGAEKRAQRQQQVSAKKSAPTKVKAPSLSAVKAAAKTASEKPKRAPKGERKSRVRSMWIVVNGGDKVIGAVRKFTEKNAGKWAAQRFPGRKVRIVNESKATDAQVGQALALVGLRGRAVQEAAAAAEGK